MSTQKPQMQHFKNENFLISAQESANLLMPGFHYSKAADVDTYESTYVKLNNVSAQVANACDAMSAKSDPAALKELCTICHHYDAKNKINWENTLIVIKLRLTNLFYKPDFIDEYMGQIRAAVLPVAEKV